MKQPTQCPKAPQCEVAKHNACSFDDVHEQCGVYKQILSGALKSKPRNNET